MIEVKSGDVRQYQRIILLLYEKSGGNSVLNKDNFRIGCCPKAGNFFRISNPLEDRVAEMKEQIQSFIDNNPDSPAAQTFEDLEDTLDQIERLINPSDPANRRQLGKYLAFILIFLEFYLRMFKITKCYERA